VHVCRDEFSHLVGVAGGNRSFVAALLHAFTSCAVAVPDSVCVCACICACRDKFSHLVQAGGNLGAFVRCNMPSHPVPLLSLAVRPCGLLCRDKFSHLVDVAGGNGSFLASLLTALPGASGAVVDQQQQVRGCAATLSGITAGDSTACCSRQSCRPAAAGACRQICSNHAH
jgi:hypothetical protein